jgi:Helix-turn-helix of DDE superfamily endonuclease
VFYRFYVKKAMRWKNLTHQTDVNFKRLVGVQKSVFLKMVEVVKATNPVSTHPQTGKKRGVKPKLNNYDKVLMMLMYYREYRPFVHIGATYNISETQCWRIVTDIEKRLIQSGAFTLPGKKKLLDSNIEWKVVVVDASEHSIERPKKSNVSTTLARKRNIL